MEKDGSGINIPYLRHWILVLYEEALWMQIRAAGLVQTIKPTKTFFNFILGSCSDVSGDGYIRLT
jgi:hypothetical protein